MTANEKVFDMRWLQLVIPAIMLFHAMISGSVWGIIFGMVACVLTFAPLWDRLRADGISTKPIARGVVAVAATLLVAPFTEQNIQDKKSDEPVLQLPKVATEKTAAEVERSLSDASASLAGSTLPNPAPTKNSSSIYEQAIFDAFPDVAPTTSKPKKRSKQAAEFIGLTINQQGFLCARLIEAMKAADNMYGVGCVTQRNGYGRTNYILNTQTGEVSKI